jgi:hypothetical protein
MGGQVSGDNRQVAEVDIPRLAHLRVVDLDNSWVHSKVTAAPAGRRMSNNA